jgi:hypothetical protein
MKSSLNLYDPNLKVKLQAFQNSLNFYLLLESRGTHSRTPTLPGRARRTCHPVPPTSVHVTFPTFTFCSLRSARLQGQLTS